MDALAFLLLLAGLGIGAALGVLLTRGRHAGLIAERNAARRSADETRAELAESRRALSSAEAQAARLGEALEREEQASAERLSYLEQTKQQLADQFSALSTQALEQNNRRFLDLADVRLKEAGALASGELEQRRQAVEHMVAPLKDTLAKVEVQLRELEQTRLSAYTALTEQVGFVQQTSEQLRTETSALVKALRAPQTRGQWGEMHLRRCVEVAGMVEHCDFSVQATATSGGATVRPDMVVRLAGGKNVVVDAKVSLAAYLDAAETSDPDQRRSRLSAHARHLRAHVDSLAGKSYWSAFTPAPELVVLFVPGEAFLAPALEQDPSLLEYAMGRHVIIATPTTLVTMLRTVAYAWQQAALTDNARAVFELGRDLHNRLCTLGEHVDKLGRSIGRVVDDYNATVGSYENRVLVTARKLNDLKVVESELGAPRPVEAGTRALTASELFSATEDAGRLRVLHSPESDEGGPGSAATRQAAGPSAAPGPGPGSATGYGPGRAAEGGDERRYGTGTP